MNTRPHSSTTNFPTRMPAIKPAKVTKSKFSTSFFTPRARRDLVRQDYNCIQRREVEPANPQRDASTPTHSTASSTTEDKDTIVIDPKAPRGDDDDDEMPDVPTPTFENTTLSEEEKLEAVNKWKVHREKHERKPREKTSHVYFYMRKHLLPGCFFAEVKGGAKALQEYRWTCNVCYHQPEKHFKHFGVLESKRRGVTSGMGDHLKLHGITKDTHHAWKA